MKLVRGDKLNEAQRKYVLSYYSVRWTVENTRREQAYGICQVCRVPGGTPGSTLVGCRQYHPVIALETDEQWLKENVFWVKKNGDLAQHRACEPAIMVVDDKS